MFYHKLLSSSLVTSSISSSLYPLSNNNSQYHTNLPPSKKHTVKVVIYMYVCGKFTLVTQNALIRVNTRTYVVKNLNFSEENQASTYQIPTQIV